MRKRHKEGEGIHQSCTVVADLYTHRAPTLLMFWIPPGPRGDGLKVCPN